MTVGLCSCRTARRRTACSKGVLSISEATFFERYPKLKDREVKRRHASDTVEQALRAAGFTAAEEVKFWEVRRIYRDLNELSQDLLSRTGRSLLHELSDEELQDLVTYITGELTRLGATENIVEQGRWTIWKAT